MEERFKAVINNYTGEGVLPNTILAVSGGIDSVLMAYLYNECGRQFTIAHCNFQLRGNDSLLDEEFVVAMGEKMGVKVLVKRFETKKYVADNGVSIQMAARDLRYNWFKELAKEFDAKIAIAHHANDVAETMLFNLAKGTGLAGLHGIAENDGIFIRPLLWAKKEEIIEFAQAHKIKWREDHSNESEKYMRNIIRKKVIPELERINPSFVITNLRSAARIKEAEKFFEYSLAQLRIVEEKEGHIYINKDVLLKLPGSRAVLYQLINSYGFSYDQVISIENSRERSGAIFMADDWVLNIDRDYLIISRSEQHLIEQRICLDEKTIELTGYSLQMKRFEAKGYKINPDKNIAGLDLEKLTFPLLIRHWQQGDSFSPLGMQGNKKVSDYMIDEKIPVNMKKKVMVLLSGKDIVWVIGYRINEYYKITSQTRQVYQVKKVFS